jgi:hypothetical protein
MEKNGQNREFSPGGKCLAVSGKVYDSIGEVLTELQKRGYPLERKQVAEAMSQTDLHCPLSDYDLGELLLYLAPLQQETNIRRARLNKVLSGGRWRNAVVMARQRLGLPKAGVSLDEAIALHNALLDEAVDGCPGRLLKKSQIYRNLRASQVWKWVFLPSKSHFFSSLLG